jgi:Asp-tRNA(Asn)/Glu-tRNA(Gln) amidotransferase A subunit family amidase
MLGAETPTAAVEIAMLSLLHLLGRMEAGELTPAASLRVAHEAITASDEEIRAFVHVDGAARAAAEGPLRGIAVGVKDIVDTADMPTEMGSPLYAGWRPKADAPVVTALRKAGATPIGKTATTAFAFLDPAPTRNPRNTGHTPGGSSSGSAAAVAAGMVPLAIGTQTGGSVIRPASYCGVAAIKPSFRLIPTVGVKTFSWALDTVGLFAASVADVAYALAAVTGRGELRIDGRTGNAPRIGVVIQDFAGDPEPDSAAAIDKAARLAERAGAAVHRVALPAVCGAAWGIHPNIQDYEGRHSLAWEYARHRGALPPLLRQLLDNAQAINAETYDEARSIAHRARGALDDVFADVDVLLTFSAPGPAPKTLASTGSARFNRLWTLLGNPCVNVPGIASGSSLPVGVQVIAPFGRDARALLAARFVEEALARD